MADLSGRTIDNYLLLRRLGGGSFGDVYLIEHIHRKTLFAAKILRAHLSQENLRAFLNEARVFRLVHPNIMRVRDFGMDGDAPFIVMDYFPGGTLRELHPRGKRLALKTIVSYVKQVGAALQYAHDEGLVHRDVKPENMLVGLQGEIVLSDFGIVTTSYTWGENLQERVAGTVAYMAPEQILARAVRASDQYALAVLTYEWLVGTPPFLGTVTELTAKHLYAQPPSLRERDPTILPTVEQVVLKALAKDPAQRFSSVLEFATALEAAAKLPVGTTLQALSMPASLLPSLAWSPDGMRLAVASSNTVSVHQIERGEAPFRSAWHDQPVTAVAWSPDGSRLASASNDHTVQIGNAETGNVHVTCKGHHEEVFTIAWSPDGARLASAGMDHSIRIWDTTTGRTVAVVASHGDDIFSVAWSPDGTRLASASYDGTVQVHAMPDQKQLWMYGSSANVYALAWSPDSTRLAAASYDATIQVREATTGNLLQTYRGHTAGVFAVAWSPDNTLLASGGDDATVQIWEAATARPVYTYRGHTRGIRAIAWSPLIGNDVYIASAGLDQTVLIWQAP
jgi:eukaryotic-like serine/threonine-protein kinase